MSARGNRLSHCGVILSFVFLSCVFAATVVNIENNGEMICIPNATFHIDCNRCKCSPTGMSMDCTDWSCATLQISHDLLLNLTLNCQSGEVFLYNEYKCLCSSEGRHATCSSARRELAHNLRPAQGPIRVVPQTPNECTPGMVFKSDCDVCVCADSGRAACLGLGCLNKNGHLEAECNYLGELPDKICIPYSSFSVDCNRCVCSGDGFSLSCDQYPCLGVEIRDDQILNITFRCEPETTFLYNRHECLCLRTSRHAICTLARPAEDELILENADGVKVISIAEFPDLCTPGVVFRDHCNVCVCGADQTAACTQLHCQFVQVSNVNIDESTQRIVPKEEIWTKRKKNVRFCKNHYASLYCTYLRMY